MSTMLTATSLPRHSRTENEPSGSVQNPLLRRRSLAGSASTSTHSESVRPRDDRPGPIARISAIHDAQVLSPTFPSTATTSAISSVSTPSLSVDLPGVLRELSSMRKEMKQAIAHMQAELATIKRGVEFLTELLLTIEKSPFKDVIGQVLGDQSFNSSLKEKARQYCKKKLTDIRSEERRRLFGIQPCRMYAKLQTMEFAVKFIVSLKVDINILPEYRTNLAVLRTFVRTVPHSNKDTFKEFRKWLKGIYGDALPPSADLEEVVKVDEEFDYSLPPTSTLTSSSPEPEETSLTSTPAT
ncbi:hypothetical protein EMCRGX_G001642 [Ephydatia muelleri]